MDSIIELATAAATIAKVIVDIIRMAADLPRWLPPALAIIGGIGSVVLLMIANRIGLDSAVLAQSVLAGILAGGLAVGVTELGARAQSATTARRGGD